MKGYSDVSVLWKPFRKIRVIEENSIHLFKTDVPSLYDKIGGAFTDVLSFEEQQKAKRFKHEKDRKRYICSKYLLRFLLSGFKGVSAQSIYFRQSFNKKPVLEGIEFNVTHSGDKIVIAIGSAPMGIDLELVREDFDFNILARTVLSPEEQLQIETGNSPLSLFYSLWTRKEALLKASGEGLTDQLDELDCLQDHIIRKEINYRLSTFLIDQKYIFSLASSQTSPKLFFWEVIL